MKHEMDWKNHVTMTIKTDGTEKEFILDTGSPVKITPLDEQLITDKTNSTDNKKISGR